MPTSNWQQIPFSVDALMKMEPTRVLDVGVGFGRWGMVVREFCDVWFGRSTRSEWKVHIEGIEGHAPNISDYHRAFYDQVHVGDAAELIPRLKGPWSVTIYGDVLEHFTKDVAFQLLRTSLSHSDYVLVNIPLGEEHPQDAVYGNEFERHRSSWTSEEFEAFGLVRHVELKDYIGRSYGSFVLSLKDPRNLRGGLFSPVPAKWDRAWSPEQAGAADGVGDGLDAVLDRVAEQAFELSFIKQTKPYALSKKLRESKLGRVLTTRRDDAVLVRALPSANTASRGTEVWMLGAAPNPSGRSVPWDFVVHDELWSRQTGTQFPHGACLMTRGGGELAVRLSGDPELTFVRHPWSGKVEIRYRGRSSVIDLYAPESTVVKVYPARPTMVEAPVAAEATTAGPGSSPTRQAVSGAGQANAGTTNGTRRHTVAGGFTAAQQAFIEMCRKTTPAAVAVTCPRYLGVTSSTESLFDVCYKVPATREEDPGQITDEELESHARTLVEAGVPQVVISGGDETQHRLMRMVKSMRPSTRCDLFFHGSYPQFSEDYVWKIFRMWVDSARSGEVYSIASDKAGFDRFVRSMGLRGFVLLNRGRGEMKTCPDLPGDEKRVGVWLSGTTYRKIPHAMLCALSMIPGVRLRGAGFDARSMEVVKFLGVATDDVTQRQLPHAALFEQMRLTHLTMYVTFIECCPMLPLESLHQGVPCLIGPNSHLFEDDAYLFERLVVKFSERAEVIADAAERAISERERIVHAYQTWYRGYDAKALESLKVFLRG